MNENEFGMRNAECGVTELRAAEMHALREEKCWLLLTLCQLTGRDVLKLARLARRAALCTPHSPLRT